MVVFAQSSSSFIAVKLFMSGICRHNKHTNALRARGRKRAMRYHYQQINNNISVKSVEKNKMAATSQLQTVSDRINLCMAQRVSMFSASRPFCIYRIGKQIALNMRTDKWIFCCQNNIWKSFTQFAHVHMDHMCRRPHTTRLDSHKVDRRSHLNKIHFGSFFGLNEENRTNRLLYYILPMEFTYGREFTN